MIVGKYTLATHKAIVRSIFGNDMIGFSYNWLFGNNRELAEQNRE